MKSLYLIGSLRNPNIVTIGMKLRENNYDVFDSWTAVGPNADDHWRDYCNARGLSYKQALEDYSACHVFDFDQFHLERCDIGVLIMPAGKSSHCEMGYMAGQGKPTFILFDSIPERYDVMVKFATPCFSFDELVEGLAAIPEPQTGVSAEEWRKLYDPSG